MMSLTFEIVIFLYCVVFFTVVQNHPVVNDKPLTVVVNTTNYNDPVAKKVIKNTADDYRPLPLPKGNFKSNDVKFGNCVPVQQIVHNENIQIDSVGPSTLGGVFEFYIDSPIKITCIEVLDKMPPSTGAEVSLKDGGEGYNWFFLNVQGKYSRGIHIIVTAYGIPDYRKIKFRKTLY